MNIAVVAANGRLGKEFVEAALAAGHTVRAGIRGDSNLESHPNLSAIQCDATNASDIRRLLRNQDAVVSAIGHIKGSDANVQTVATQTILTVMQEMNITRFVDVTGTGVRFPGDKISLVDIFLNLAVGIVDPARVKDGKDHVEVLKTSSVEWTTIRVLKLQNVKPQAFELKLHGPTKWYVGRREVALAMLQVLEHDSFIKQAPIISRATSAKS